MIRTIFLLALFCCGFAQAECTSHQLLDYWLQHKVIAGCDMESLRNAFHLRWKIQQGPTCKKKNSACDAVLKTPAVYDQKCFEALENEFVGEKEKVPSSMGNMTMKDYFKKLNCRAPASRVCNIGQFRSYVGPDGLGDVAATKCVASFRCTEFSSVSAGDLERGKGKLVCKGYRNSCADVSFENCPAFGKAAQIRQGEALQNSDEAGKE
jgi:hypothetical protein